MSAPSSFRRIAVVALVAATGVLLPAAAAIGSGGGPPGRPAANTAGRTTAAAAVIKADPVKASDYFTREEIDRSRRYTRPRYALGFASMTLGLAVAALLGLGAPTRAMGAWAERVTGARWPFVALLLAGIVTVVPALVTLPLSVARGLSHERSFGLSTQTLGGYLSDFAKGTLFQLVLTAVAALGFFLIARRLPRGWPFVAAGFMIALTVALVVVYPLVYEPLFNKFTPVDGATRDRIVALATKAGVGVDKVLVADASRRTTKQNAYVSGLGATKRVVLYDTLLAKSSSQEVDLVVAHELGHVVHKDVLRGTLLASAGAAATVAIAWALMARPGIRSFTGATGAEDPRALPFLALVLSVATILTLPAANGFSRRIEASADRFAVRLTGDAQTAVKVEVNLARDNVSDLHPNAFIAWMFFSHPPTLERIAIALEEGRRLTKP